VLRLSLLNKISLDQSHAKHVGYPAKHYINQRRSLLQQHPKIKVVDFNLPFDIIKDIVCLPLIIFIFSGYRDKYYYNE